VSRPPAYRSLPLAGETAEAMVTVDGERVAAPRGRSLLAILLAVGKAGAAADFTCGIGQCQRCAVLVDGVPRLACTFTPRGGERVSTAAFDGRPPPWDGEGPR
jgi:aerobic-type carbon monoxide dehydrogenase small subunit (CoxS/CutS family)